MRVLFILVFSFLLGITFQNCAKTDIDAQSIQTSSSTNVVGSGNGQGYDGLNSGNGQGYDGKLSYSGDYFRWQANYTCNLSGTPTNSWYEKITFDASGTGMVSGDLCGNPAPSLPVMQGQVPPPSQIISSFETEIFAFLPNMISYKTNLFEKSNPPMMPAQGLPYMYCRTGLVYDSQFIEGILVIVRRSPAGSQSFSAEIYWGKLNSTVSTTSYLAYAVPNFKVSSSSVLDVSETFTRPDFSLSVDLT